MIGEIWKTAVYDDEVYEGLYKVSNFGRILSLNYNHTGKVKLRKPVNVNGYLVVVLSKNKEKKQCYVHRLVAETFLPNPEGKSCVNHKIEGKKGKTMNMVFFNKDGSIDKKRTTIEWATYEENNNYATRNERISKISINGKKSKRVLQYTLDDEFVREWPSVNECGRNGFNKGHVSRCCRGEIKSHKGFRFMYK